MARIACLKSQQRQKDNKNKTLKDFINLSIKTRLYFFSLKEIFKSIKKYFLINKKIKDLQIRILSEIMTIITIPIKIIINNLQKVKII